MGTIRKKRRVARKPLMKTHWFSVGDGSLLFFCIGHYKGKISAWQVNGKVENRLSRNNCSGVLRPLERCCTQNFSHSYPLFELRGKFLLSRRGQRMQQRPMSR